MYWKKIHYLFAIFLSLLIFTSQNSITLGNNLEIPDTPVESDLNAPPPAVMLLLDDSTSMDTGGEAWNYPGDYYPEQNGNLSAIKTNEPNQIPNRFFNYASYASFRYDNTKIYTPPFGMPNTTIVHRPYHNYALNTTRMGLDVGLPWGGIDDSSQTDDPRTMGLIMELPYYISPSSYTWLKTPWNNAFYYTRGSSYYAVCFPTPTTRAVYNLTSDNWGAITPTIENSTLMTDPAIIADALGPNPPTPAEDFKNWLNWYRYYQRRVDVAKTVSVNLLHGLSNVQIGAMIMNNYQNVGAVPPQPINVYNSSNFIDNSTAVINYISKSYRLTYCYTGVRTFSNTPGNWVGTPLRWAYQILAFYFTSNSSSLIRTALPSELGLTSFNWPTVANGGECQSTHIILLTDGGYTEGYLGVPAPLGASFGNVDAHEPAPFGPSITIDSLADMTRYYYENDIAPALGNKVSPITCPTPLLGSQDTYQRIITDAIGFGGEFAGMSANDPCDSSLNWRNDEIRMGSHETDIDYTQLDLKHAVVDGRGTFFLATDYNSLVDSLTSIFTNILSSPTSNTAVYSGGPYINGSTINYQSSYIGSFWTGKIIAENTTIVNGSLHSTLIWDSSELLDQRAPSTRIIIASNGTSAENFNASTPSVGLVSALSEIPFKGDGTDNGTQITPDGLLTADIINYVRGENVNNTRTRSHIQGDIIHSNILTIPNQALFVGGNDGMLHAFDLNVPNDGKELFAFIPRGALPNLRNLQQFTYRGNHRYFVDGQMNAKNMNGTIFLVGGMGKGGNSVYALNITNINSVTNPTLAQQRFLWDFPYNQPNSIKDKMFFSFGTPVITKLNVGGIPKNTTIFTSGYSMKDNMTQTIFVLDLQTGALIRSIDLDIGSGLAPVAVLEDAQGITSYAYVGDLEGRMWRIDLSDPTNVNAWNATVLLNAGSDRPITTRAAVTQHPISGSLVLFGTGRTLSKNTDSNLTTAQCMFGIWDKDYNATWGNFTYTPGQADTFISVPNWDLVEQKKSWVDSPNNTLRNTTSYPVNYVDSSQTMNAGWFVALPGLSQNAYGLERISNNILLPSDAVIFVSSELTNQPCISGGPSAISEVDALTGQALKYEPFNKDLSKQLNPDNTHAKSDIVFKDTVKLSENSIVPSDGSTPSLPDIKNIGHIDTSITGLLEAHGKPDKQSWREIH